MEKIRQNAQVKSIENGKNKRTFVVGYNS